ncbi:hypothetical protein BC830DRAFT_330030 [Chytriomyces sp. MP71]|nr:hypothetical protein BC830DRAFT_330030 [Chytriomyces sp. MP71]
MCALRLILSCHTYFSSLFLKKMIMREMGAPARVTSPAKRATTAGEEVVDADMTDWPRMAVLLHAHATRWLDSIFVVIVNGAILACAVVAGLVGYLVIGPLANVLFPTLATTFRIPDPAANAQIVLPTEKLRVYPSALSASAPRFFSTFADKWQKDQAFSVNAIEDALCRVPVTDAEKKTRPPFSISAAKLLMHLSALVYEAPEVIGHFAKQYGFNLETVAGNGASVNIFYSVELRVVILVFRGSNPLVLSEFLTSAMIQSMKADRNALPGAVHEAYLNLLSFPNSVKEDEVESGANTAGKFKIVSEALQRNAPKPFATPGLSIEGILQTLETVIFPKFEEHALQEHKRLQNVHSDLRTANGRPVEVQMKQPGPFIWFTGHSTGACLASLVLGHLVHTTNPVVSAGLIKGCYTFGSPKCGNTEFATSMARSCTANQIPPQLSCTAS